MCKGVHPSVHRCRFTSAPGADYEDDNDDYLDYDYAFDDYVDDDYADDDYADDDFADDDYVDNDYVDDDFARKLKTIESIWIPKLY